MTKLLILSDSHNSPDVVQRILRDETGVDALIFLGDGLRDLEQGLTQHPRLRTYAVAGNCDYGALEPLDGLAAFDKTVVFYTHGHMYGVKYDLDTLAQAAAARGGGGGAVRPSTPYPPGRAAGRGVPVQPRLLRPVLYRAGYLRYSYTGRWQGHRPCT